MTTKLQHRDSTGTQGGAFPSGDFLHHSLLLAEAAGSPVAADIAAAQSGCLPTRAVSKSICPTGLTAFDGICGGNGGGSGGFRVEARAVTNPPSTSDGSLLVPGRSPNSQAELELPPQHQQHYHLQPLLQQPQHNHALNDFSRCSFSPISAANGSCHLNYELPEFIPQFSAADLMTLECMQQQQQRQQKFFDQQHMRMTVAAPEISLQTVGLTNLFQQKFVGQPQRCLQQSATSTTAVTDDSTILSMLAEIPSTAGDKSKTGTCSGDGFAQLPWSVGCGYDYMLCLDDSMLGEAAQGMTSASGEVRRRRPHLASSYLHAFHVTPTEYFWLCSATNCAPVHGCPTPTLTRMFAPD